MRATRKAARTVIPRASICSSPKSLPSLGGNPARLSVSGSKSRNCLYFCCKSLVGVSGRPRRRLLIPGWLGGWSFFGPALFGIRLTGKVRGRTSGGGGSGPATRPVAMPNIDTSAPVSIGASINELFRRGLAARGQRRGRADGESRRICLRFEGASDCIAFDELQVKRIR